MDRFFEALRPFIRGVVRHAAWVLVGAVALTAAALWLASGLRIDTDFAKLLPPDRPSVQALERLRSTVGGESDVAVAIQSPSFEANKAFAEALVPRALALQAEDRDEPFFTRADFRRDADFLRDNALYFASDEELTRLETYLDEQIEEANLEANPFYFPLEEEEAEEDTAAQELEEIYDGLTVSEYQLSPDSTTLVVRFFPSGAQTDIGFIESTYAALDGLVEAMEPQQFHPQMEVTLAGRLYRQLVEVGTIQRDVAGSFGVGVLAVLVVVMLYFLYKGVRARAGGGRFSMRLLGAELLRMPALGLLIALPLLMSLAWTGAVAYLAFTTLNLMTSTLGLVLFGLGIDFGIHFYARYTEERAEGRPVLEAAEETFVSTGQAITVGAMTTAAGLYVLTLADFRGFSEFGFIAGTGVLFALVAMTVVLPALVAVFERVGLLNLSARAAEGKGAAPAAARFPAARPLVVGSLVAVTIAVVLLPQVDFQYDFGALEPDYPEWRARDNVVELTETGGGSGRNPAYVVTSDRSEVPAVVAALRQEMAEDTTSPTIESVESLQERFPLGAEEQEAKLGRIAAIRATLNRSALREDSTEEIQKLRRAAQTTAPIALEEVPDYLKKRFTSKSGEVGGFVIVYPSVGLSDGRNSIAFAEDVATFSADGETYHAASTSLVAADMLELMLAEAPWMILATLLIVAALMWLNFRSVRWALLALVPLVVGILWMLLLMEVFGLALNFYNLVVLPAVLGIGNDAGVHLVHRYREEGRGSIWRVLRSTGEHVTMGSLTTMIGFGGLLLSFHPGLRSIGELAVAGIGATLLAALVFLPALLQWLEDRRALRPDAPVAPGGNGQAAEAPPETATARSA